VLYARNCYEAFGEARAARRSTRKRHVKRQFKKQLQTDPETGQVTFGELPEAKGYGAEYNK
jgi:hypothetical protein